ncbi:Re/Si-specific NAD(P)(+) transhydrogenase subunit alpha [Aestuariimicrobium ganziense]|uniref:Re/Si-specific NAD(P)(+) transhydrogenase subunit alpha n=1 Tax=Aestuariimicrobium ganziense TaxID=2773677 RepID=UPI001942A5E6|nr:Re/Si-specific NAD(P)(+) transhydrogenase subunit alpha [Aestuariimicrobium ganziense]
MRIGIPKESRSGETRVAATPKTVTSLTKLGYAVVIETGAGKVAAFDDAAYAEAGAVIVDRAEVWASDIVLKINAPDSDELPLTHRGQTVISLMSPRTDPAFIEQLQAHGLTGLAMDAVPRISRAQSLDVLSSMANIGGYRAVIEAAHEFGSLFTGQVTAAGKVPPATVLVIGAGVAGLAAIGTARSLGAIVRAFDARSEVAEQVESMGADFLHIDAEDTGPSADGYARETTDDFNAKAAALYAEQVKEVDIIITTALIPGRPAPRLITEEMVASMKPGSVVVDMAAGSGGNVAGSRADEKVLTDNDVTILGYTDLPGRLPTQASQLFGTNLVNLMALLTPGKDGQLVLDMDDPVQRGMTVTRDGDLLWPPPPVQVSAAPAVVQPAVTPAVPTRPTRDPGRTRAIALGVGGVLFLLLSLVSPPAFLSHMMVFVLAVVIGYYVIGNVHHALHTPLMSVTNAISGIILVGALLQVSPGDWALTIVAAVAILVASINVFGGFTVTARMLQMFQKGDQR